MNRLVTPFVGVWIETISRCCTVVKSKSHPSWVCGLKPYPASRQNAAWVSHPSWVCGLKHVCIDKYLELNWSHPSWVCGLKQESSVSL